MNKLNAIPGSLSGVLKLGNSKASIDNVDNCVMFKSIVGVSMPVTQNANQLRKQGASVQFILDHILLVVEMLRASSTGNSEAGLNTSCLK